MMKNVANRSVLILTCFVAYFVVAGKSLEPILWSIHNKMFELKTHSTQHVEAHTIEVRIGEFLNIVCPKYPVHNSANTIEYHALHKVTKEEYDECKIRDINVKHPILKCDRPYENVKYTLYISKFSPVPDAIEFTPGNSYYFISTSNGTYNGLNNDQHGTCLTNNMKLIIKVLDSKSVTTKSSTTESYSKTSPSTVEPIRASTESPLPSTYVYSSDVNRPNDDYYDFTVRKRSSTSSILITKLRSLTFNFVNSTKSSKLLAYEQRAVEASVNPSHKWTDAPASSTTVTTTTTTTTSTKTVTDDNIFILEPDSIDYNDILSQLIFSSSPLSSSSSSSASSSSSYLNSDSNNNFKKSLNDVNQDQDDEGDSVSESENLSSSSSNKSNQRHSINRLFLFSISFFLFCFINGRLI